MGDFMRPAVVKAFFKKIKRLVGWPLVVFLLSAFAFLKSNHLVAEEEDFFTKHAQRSKELIARWKESLNRMNIGSRFTIPHDSPKKKGSFQVTQAYLDSKIIPFTDQRSFEVVSNELNQLCLQCSNWKKIFGKNTRLPTTSACEKLRKENATGTKTRFPPHPETKQVGRPCTSGYLVKTTTGALDNCYCMAEDLAEKAFMNDVIPVADTCKVEVYDKKTGQRNPDRSYTYEEFKKELPAINKAFASLASLLTKSFVPKVEGKAVAGELLFKPHEKMKFAQYTNSDLFTSEGQPALQAGLGARLMCPDVPERLAEEKKPRYFMSSKFNKSKCPCESPVGRLPESLSLPAMSEDYAKVGRFGESITYKLVDESLLPKGLQRQTTAPVRRTGYGITDNSPPGDNAGFAAVRRKIQYERDKKSGKMIPVSIGRASLGANSSGMGTLDHPVTTAISPDFARKYNVCQGDMLYDPSYGWLRVEGGCTSEKYNGKDLGERVDIWRGNLSKQEEGLNEPTSFVHFPAALIDKDFAAKNPGPIRKAK